MGNSRRKAGTGSVFHTPTGWVAQVRFVDPFTGKSKQIRRRAKSRDDARAKLAKLREDTKSISGATDSTTVAEYLAHYSTTALPTLGYSASTIDTQRVLIANPLTPTLGKIKLKDFTTATATQWLIRLDESTALHANPKMVRRPLSGATKRKSFYVLKKALDIAKRDGVIASNPLEHLTPPAAGKPVVPVVSEDAFEKIKVTIAGTRSEPLVILIGLTGIRLGEALGLMWSDVDLDAKTITIRRSSSSTDRTKTGNIRTIPITSDVVAALSALQASQEVEAAAAGRAWANRAGFVFVTATGALVDPHNARRDYKRLLIRDGLDTARPFHSLRHGLAARLLRAGVPIAVVSTVLGHADIKMTANTYGHLVPTDYADILDVALRQSVPGGQPDSEDR